MGSEQSDSAGSTASACPVDHSKFVAEAKEQAAVIAASKGQPDGSTEACPVDHSQWANLGHGNGGEGLPPLKDVPEGLSSAREVSSIPRSNGAKWVYPSEQQFYSAMKRKSHNPEARDMPTVIPIHNAVNERAWAEILQWENGRGGDACGGPRLVKFEGDASKWTPKAYINYLVGNKPPFDRHDWVVDRCGTQIDYVIDFYSGRPDPRAPHVPAFYLDVRPKLNSVEGIRMRLQRLFW